MEKNTIINLNTKNNIDIIEELDEEHSNTLLYSSKEKNNKKFNSEDDLADLEEEKSMLSINAIRSLEERSLNKDISFENSIIKEEKKTKSKKNYFSFLEEKKTTKKINNSLNYNIKKIKKERDRPNTDRSYKKKHKKQKSLIFKYNNKKKDVLGKIRQKSNLTQSLKKPIISPRLIFDTIEKLKKKTKKDKIIDIISFKNLKEKNNKTIDFQNSREKNDKITFQSIKEKKNKKIKIKSSQAFSK